VSDWKFKLWKVGDCELVNEKIIEDKTEEEMRQMEIPKNHRATFEIYEARENRRDIQDQENIILGSSI
tara:strand:- start:1 stop:204 length:204 start_codon:yes stop_codon:yes gene_type:complete